MPVLDLLKLRLRNVNACALCAAAAVFLAEGRSNLFAADRTPTNANPPSSSYKTTNLWEAHFHFTPDQWEAMPPEENGGGLFGPGPGRPGGPGGPNFGPGMFLAPVFMRAGDKNGDGLIAREEFQQLASSWFAQWDKKSAAKLKEEDLRDGLNAAITAAPGGGPGPRLQGSEGKRNGLASAAGIQFEYVKGDLRIGEKEFRSVAVRYKGNGTWMGSRFDKKRSLKVDLNEFVKGQKYAGASKLNFHNCVTDPGFMNEVLSYQLYRDAGVPAPRTAYARVFIDVPGKHQDEYFGVYSVVENIDTAFFDDRFGTKKGAIFKPVTREPFEYQGEDWARYNQMYDPKTDLGDREKRRVIEFCKLVSEADDAEFAARVGDYLDLDEFSRYMAVTAWLATLDSILSIGQNYYVYLHPKTEKLQFIPWDLDHSFGQFFLMGSPEQRERLSIDKPWQGEIKFLARVYKTDAFQKLYRARLEEFTNSIFQPDRFVQQVDQVAAAIRNYVKEESDAKLERFDKVVAGEPVSPSFGPPPGRPPFGGGAGGGTPRFGPPGFMQPSKPIKGFVKVRAESVKNQLSGKEKGERLDDGFGGRGPRGFGPGNFIAPGLQAQLDADKNGELSRGEFEQGFANWFASWDAESRGSLTEDQLRAGLNRAFQPPSFGPGGPRPPEGEPGIAPPGGESRSRRQP